MKYDAFISYRRESYGTAQFIASELKHRYGLDCYIDTKEHEEGDYGKHLHEAIANSSNFLVVLSENALDECVHEGDWVRREVIAAFKNKNKNKKRPIIPVIYPNFKWPTDLDENFPEEIVNLKNQQGVIICHEYSDVAIQKIVGYMKNIEPKNLQKESLYAESSNFISNKVRTTENLISVDMAFHSGAEWRNNSDMVKTLSELISTDCKIRIIVNSSKAVKDVCKHMRQPLKDYISFQANIAKWKAFIQPYSDNIQIRVLDVPLLHRLYIVRGECGGSANIKYYSYGNYTPEKDFRLTFDSPAPEYKLYQEEFEYLWSISNDIKA